MGEKWPENAVSIVEIDPEGKPFDQVLVASGVILYGVDYSADFLIQNDNGKSADTTVEGEQQ